VKSGAHGLGLARSLLRSLPVVWAVCVVGNVGAREAQSLSHVGSVPTAASYSEQSLDELLGDVRGAAAQPPVALLPPAAPLSVDMPEIDQLMAEALRTKKTPGAVVVVGRAGGVVFERAYGQRELVPRRADMTTDTIFDLASLTKPLVVGTLVAALMDQGKLHFEDLARTYLPELDFYLEQRVTLQHLLLHTSGLPASNPLSEYQGGARQALARTLQSPVLAVPGQRFEYSDIGYIALGVLLERATGERLDALAKRLLWQPLGMHDTGYCVPVCKDPRIAPTDLSLDREMSPIRGQVHDPRAYRLGGVAGNAGLFSSAPDLVRYSRMLLSNGELDGVRVLSPEAVQRFTEPHEVTGGERSAGWDVSAQFHKQRGTLLSPRAFGHGGYTGTQLWIDPEQDLFVLFLSNRNHPYGTGRVLELEGQIVDAAIRALHPAEAHESSSYSNQSNSAGVAPAAAVDGPPAAAAPAEASPVETANSPM
jgi:CubicO group peptidase (beta-lactamase class C family)